MDEEDDLGLPSYTSGWKLSEKPRSPFLIDVRTEAAVDSEITLLCESLEDNFDQRGAELSTCLFFVFELFLFVLLLTGNLAGLVLDFGAFLGGLASVLEGLTVALDGLTAGLDGLTVALEGLEYEMIGWCMKGVSPPIKEFLFLPFPGNEQLLQNVKTIYQKYDINNEPNHMYQGS